MHKIRPFAALIVTSYKRNHFDVFPPSEVDLYPKRVYWVKFGEELSSQRLSPYATLHHSTNLIKVFSSLPMFSPRTKDIKARSR